MSFEQDYCTDEEDSEVQLWVQRQIEQEEQDKHDLKLFHEHKQEECPGHEYEFLEPLPSSEPDVFKDLYVCILCSHERVITHHAGVRDD
jgi:hypothetical protein